MNTILALLVAQARTTWNRAVQDAGIFGPLANLASAGLVVLIVLVPSVAMFAIAFDVAADVSAGKSGMPNWNLLTAFYVFFFGLAGSLRYRPAFSWNELGRLPIARWQLLLAELPASFLEVTPIYGGAGLVTASLALAWHLPLASPLIFLLLLQGLLLMQSTTILGAGLRSFLARGRRRLTVAAALAGATLFTAGWSGIRHFLRSDVRAAVPFLPSSQGYTGLVELYGGQVTSGVSRMAGGAAATFLFVLLAAAVHGKALSATAPSSGRRSTLFTFKSPAAGVGRLFQKELLDSAMGRFLFVMPLIYTVPMTFFIETLQRDAKGRGLLGDVFRLTAEDALALPWLKILLYLVVVFNSAVWMNQFGWDRQGVRGLLTLPISPRELLAGKLIGLLRFTGAQALLGTLPLLWVYRPTLGEVLTGVGGAGTLFVVLTAVGHFFSVRFPRAVLRDGSAMLPLHISWIPTVLIFALLGVVITVQEVAKLLGAWAPPLALLALLGAAAVAYVRGLDVLGEQLRRNQERLLRI